jgi:hypothetical protein
LRSRFRRTLSLAAVAISLCTGAAVAADLGPWFANASQYQTSVVGVKTAGPDNIAGKGKPSACGESSKGAVPFGVWALLRYDTAHHLALAAAATDQCSVSLFSATLPAGVSVLSADLSSVRTKRGLGIGSTMKDVIATYGGHAKATSGRVVMAYDAQVPDKNVNDKPVILPQRITVVLKDGRVTAITLSTDESGMM